MGLSCSARDKVGMIAIAVVDDGPVVRQSRTNSGTVYYPVLDGLRAISVFLVIQQHTVGRRGALGLIPGWLGVDVFFALSGFLITLLLMKELQAKDRVDLPAFYIRRVFRIVPVYLCILGIYLGYNYLHAGPDWSTLKHALPYYLSFMNEWPPHAPFDFTWTLGIEEKFYVLWPALAFIVFKRHRSGFALTTYLLFVAFCPWSYQTARCYSGLILGSALAIAFEGQHGARLKSLIATVPVLVPAALVAICCALAIFSLNAVFLFQPAILFLIAHLLNRRSGFAAFLSSRPMVWVGKRSYSMYLVHGLCLGMIEKLHQPVGAWAHAGVALGTTLTAALSAQVLYLFIENPSRTFAKKLIYKRTARTYQRLTAELQAR